METHSATSRYHLEAGNLRGVKIKKYGLVVFVAPPLGWRTFFCGKKRGVITYVTLSHDSVCTGEENSFAWGEIERVPRLVSMVILCVWDH